MPRIVRRIPPLIILLLILSGCQTQQAQNIQVVWSTGGCMLLVDNISLEQAAEIQKEWELEHCKVTVKKASQ